MEVATDLAHASFVDCPELTLDAVVGQAPGKVLAELTAAPARPCITAGQIAAAHDAVNADAAGFGIWVAPHYPRPFDQQNQMVVDALRLIAATDG